MLGQTSEHFTSEVPSREIVGRFAEIAKKCPRFVIPPEFLDNLMAEDLETSILVGTLGTLPAINFYRQHMQNPYVVAEAAGIQVLSHNPMDADDAMERNCGCAIVTTPIDGWHVVNHDNRTIHQIRIGISCGQETFGISCGQETTAATNSFMDVYFAKLHDAKYTDIVPQCGAMVYCDHDRNNGICNGAPMRKYDWNYDLIDIYENLYIISLWAASSPDILDELLKFASVPGVGRVLQAVHHIYEAELQPMILISNAAIHKKFMDDCGYWYNEFSGRYNNPKHAIIPATFAKIANIVNRIIYDFERGNAVSRFSAGMLNIGHELRGQISPIELITVLSKYVHITGNISPEFACEIIASMRGDPILLSQICAEIRESPLEKYEQVQILIQDIIDEINNPEPELFAIWDRYINQPADDDFNLALPKKSQLLPD